MRKEVTSTSLKYICPDNSSETEKEANPITAEEIVDAIKSGKNIEIINAVIEGAFILKHINIDGKITIQRTKIKGQVDWSYAAFKQVLNLENSTFETDATFTGIMVEKDIFQDNVTFMGDATFSDVTIDGIFHSGDSTFKKEAIFVGSVFKKRVEFSKSTFEGKVDFGITRIGSVALFNGVKFEKQVIFNSTKIEGATFFNSAILEGDVDFIGAQIYNTVEFYKAQFKQMANFGSARIKINVRFTSTIFKGKVNFNLTRIEGSAFFDTAIFEDEANFGSARIGGIAMFNGAKFKKLVNFNGAKIDGAVFFNKVYLFRWDKIPGSDDKGLIDLITHDFGIDCGKTNKIEKKIDDDKTIIISAEKNTLSLSLNNKKTKVNLKIDDGRTDELFVMQENGKLNIYKKPIFEDEADFGSTRIGNEADFSETVFRKQVNFSSATIEGSAFFNKSIFEDEVNFIATRFGGNATFDEAKFCQEAKFSIAKIMGYTKFNSVIFEKNVNFSGVIVGIAAEFNNTKFNKKAIFNSAKIEGAAFFRSAIFRSDFDFIGVQNCLAAEFQNAEFIQTANFSFAHIKKHLKFESTIFNDKVEIEHAQIEEAISLKGAYFANDVSFKYTSLGTFYFENLHIQPNVKIDLRGCIYDDIDPINSWEELTEKEHLFPYDRQPFSQLEKTLRRAGKDDLADNVYYKGRCREFSENNITIQKPFAWINWFFWLLKEVSLQLLTGYGVRVKRLLIFIVLILLAGTYIFNQPGAVILKPEVNQTILIWPMDSYLEAFYVSLNLFLPIEIPSGTFWKPSQNFAIFGTLLKLAGWILVPIGVAGISGLLKRSK